MLLWLLNFMLYVVVVVVVFYVHDISTKENKTLIFMAFNIAAKQRQQQQQQ